MSEFYGIDENSIPGFVGIAGTFIPSSEVPEATRKAMHDFLADMRSMHAWDPLAFESVIGLVQASIMAVDTADTTDAVN